MAIEPNPDPGFDWGNVAPAEPPEQVVRQIRIMMAAGKGSREIRSWLLRNGFSADQADTWLADLTQHAHSDRWERFCSWASLVLIGLLTLFVVVLVVVKRPWDGTNWRWSSGAKEIDATAGFVFFCLLYVAVMPLVWYSGMRLGRFLDLMGGQDAPRGFWIVLLLVGFLTVAALATIFIYG